ncbi:hypothetical protein FACS189447_03200 [Spirochaetia bacterium]|nr:hypothetical protein FACS189447_03200 [Spirochaetia bacterium]
MKLQFGAEYRHKSSGLTFTYSDFIIDKKTGQTLNALNPTAETFEKHPELFIIGTRNYYFTDEQLEKGFEKVGAAPPGERPREKFKPKCVFCKGKGDCRLREYPYLCATRRYYL